MALKPQNTTAQELKFAYRLLLKLHGQVNNTYLLLAIIAWVRESNNVKRMYWSSESALNAAVASTVKLLSTKAYADVLSAIRHAPKGDFDTNGDGVVDLGSGAQQQVLDFFYALFRTPWATKQYGFFGALILQVAPLALYSSTLYKRWSDLLGHVIKMPADTIPQPKPPPLPKPPPRPSGVRARLHTVPGHDYITPYGARDFYDQRREAPLTPTGDRPEW